MVVRFGYRWADQRQASKDRPACIVLVADEAVPRNVARSEKQVLKKVVYLPITTKPPRPDQIGIEIPPRAAADLNLRGERRWDIATESNMQFWRNDLRQ